jgi:SSS family solute:Na+ symporter
MDIYKAHFKPDAKDREMVRVGRYVAFTALLIAVIMARPLLGGLDQAFQYIQEYTGYIYPGVCVVFFMGLFWKQATPNAALWTAIITIPAGIIIKLIYPEMPFILRMGYVTIVLVFVATIFSLLDQSTKIEREIPRTPRTRLINNAGWLFVISGLISLIAGIVFSRSLKHLGIESIFMLATVFEFLGLILLLNIRMRKADSKAFDVNHKLFRTGPIFNLGSIGLILIVAILYFIFW